MKLLKKFVVSIIIIGMVIIFSSVEGVAATKDTASQRWDGTVGASFHAGGWVSTKSICDIKW